jgi:RNA polymerase sigma factor (sigma-70 family)
MPFDPDTTLGGPNHRFPVTRQSMLADASSSEPALRRQAFSDVLEAYWKPVYKYIRLHWRKSNEDAKDLTQGFFTSLLERDWIEKYDPTRAAFRTYVRTCVDGFLMHDTESASRLKRGGGLKQLDFESAEQEVSAAASTQISGEEYFYREWQRHLFALAVEDLRRHCVSCGKPLHYRLFEEYDLAETDRPTYQELAHRHGLSATSVTNHLAWARRELRRILLERLAPVTAGESEFRREARFLLG